MHHTSCRGSTVQYRMPWPRAERSAIGSNTNNQPSSSWLPFFFACSFVQSCFGEKEWKGTCKEYTRRRLPDCCELRSSFLLLRAARAVNLSDSSYPACAWPEAAPSVSWAGPPIMHSTWRKVDQIMTPVKLFARCYLFDNWSTMFGVFWDPGRVRKKTSSGKENNIALKWLV